MTWISFFLCVGSILKRNRFDIKFPSTYFSTQDLVIILLCVALQWIEFVCCNISILTSIEEIKKKRRVNNDEKEERMREEEEEHK